MDFAGALLLLLMLCGCECSRSQRNAEQWQNESAQVRSEANRDGNDEPEHRTNDLQNHHRIRNPTNLIFGMQCGTFELVPYICLLHSIRF